MAGESTFRSNVRPTFVVFWYLRFCESTACRGFVSSGHMTGGARLWRRGEFFAGVLIWQGYGLSNTLGAAGFPNGEAFRMGRTYPDGSVCGAFIRETIDFGGERKRPMTRRSKLGGTSVTLALKARDQGSSPLRATEGWRFVRICPLISADSMRAELWYGQVYCSALQFVVVENGFPGKISKCSL